MPHRRYGCLLLFFSSLLPSSHAFSRLFHGRYRRCCGACGLIPLRERLCTAYARQPRVVRTQAGAYTGVEPMPHSSPSVSAPLMSYLASLPRPVADVALLVAMLSHASCSCPKVPARPPPTLNHPSYSQRHHFDNIVISYITVFQVMSEPLRRPQTLFIVEFLTVYQRSSPS